MSHNKNKQSHNVFPNKLSRNISNWISASFPLLNINDCNWSFRMTHIQNYRSFDLPSVRLGMSVSSKGVDDMKSTELNDVWSNWSPRFDGCTIPSLLLPANKQQYHGPDRLHHIYIGLFTPSSDSRTVTVAFPIVRVRVHHVDVVFR